MPARQYTATASTVTMLSVAFIAACAAGIVVSAGAAAPLCVIAGLGSILAIGLSLNNDMVAGSTQVTSGNPNAPPRLRVRDEVKWYRQHDTGFLEDYTGRIHELRTLNESTFTMLDAKLGWYHHVEKKPDNAGFKVRTNLKQGMKGARQAEGPSGWIPRKRTFPVIAARSSAPSLSSAVVDTQQLVSDASYASSGSAYSSAAADIFNTAYGLGTYCVTISSSGGQPADVGLTLQGGIQASNSEPPCKASKRLKKKSF